MRWLRHRADLHTLVGNARVSDATAYWRLQEALDVIAAHSPDLHQVVAVAELLDDGVGQLVAVPADVAREEDVARTAATAIAEFDRFDTWVNNAAVSVLGTTTQMTMEGFHRVFDVVFWSVVYDCRQAVALARRLPQAERSLDRYMERHMWPSQIADDRPSRPRKTPNSPQPTAALWTAGCGMHERGSNQGWHRRRSY